MKIVLTGTAGRLGSHLRNPLSKLSDELISTDLADDEVGRSQTGLKS